MPPVNPSPRKDPRGLLWIDIDDFTPGIYSSDPTSGAQYTYSHAAPLGAAQEYGTVGCLPVLGGGIGPGPSRSSTLPVFNVNTYFKSATTSYISAIVTNPNVLSTTANQTEIIFVMEGLSQTAGKWRQIVFSLYNGSYQILYAPGQQNVTIPYPVGGTAFSTRVALNNPTTVPGNPTFSVSVPYPFDTANVVGGTGPVVIYPDPANLTTFSAVLAFSNATPTNTSGLTVGYGGRIIDFGVDTTNWPAGSATKFESNEAINYTDPSNSYTNAAQGITLVPENPFGYGAAGSISDGELFVVKQRQGGAVLTGDMNNPNVTNLPGVQPTGSLPSISAQKGIYPIAFGQGDSSAQGFYYCSGDQGAWRWNGGNTSQKISSQLNDNFFYSSLYPYAALFYKVKRWGEYILFSNGWMYNESIGSWWALGTTSSASGINDFWYADALESSQMLSFPTQYQGSTGILGSVWDRSVPVSAYFWRSQPIRLTEDSNVDIREIAIRAVGPPTDVGTNSCTIQVSLANESMATSNTGTNVGTITLNNSPGSNPTTYRLPVGFKAQNLSIFINPINSAGNAAPTIFSISIGYKMREKVTTI